MCGFASAIVAGGTESMSLVPMGGHKIAPNPTLIDSLSGRVSEHRAGRRESRARVGHLARGAGRVRAAQPSARDGRDRGRPIRRRNRPGRPRRCVDAGRTASGTRSRRPVGEVRPSRSTKGRGATPRSRRSRSCGRRSTSQARVTAGNSSQTSDGAAAVIVTSAAHARERGLTPLARFVAFATAGVEPERFGIGPVPGDPEGAEAGRADARSDRPRRAERSVRRAGPRLPEGAADRSGSAERQRRRDRARPSARLHRREADDDAAVRDETAQRPLRHGDDVRRRRHGRGRNI